MALLKAKTASGHGPSASGFTLIEFVVALVLIAAGAAILTSFVTPTARSADPQLQAQARMIATAYMDEILLREHASPGDCGGGTRGSYDTVWCYDGISEPPHDQFGNAIAALSNYSVSVSVSGGGPALIDVTVSHGGTGINIDLQSQRGDY